VDTSTWNWEPGERLIVDLNACKDKYEWIEELHASPDGEKLGAVVNVQGEFSACVNGEAWDQTFERVWNLHFGPKGQLTASASDMGEWKFVVDGEPWEQSFGYVWNTKFSKDGSKIGVAVQQDMEYGVAINGEIWETLYANGTGFVLSDCGNHAALAVQVEDMAQADIYKYQKGIYTVAVDGKAWDATFTNIFGMAFSPDGAHVAAEARVNLYEQTIVVDGKPWNQRYQGVWNPTFNPVSGAVIAPVRQGGKWTLAQDGLPIWNFFANCWQPQFSKDGSTLAAIVATKLGTWTVAVDGRPWNATADAMVSDMLVSADGRTVAALGKIGEQWTGMVNGKIWPGRYDMAWAPVLSPDGEHVAARVEKNGKFTVVVDGKEYSRAGDNCFDPVFSADSRFVLVKMVEGGKYYRRVVPVSEFK